MNLEFDLYAKDNASKAIDDVGSSAKTSAARLADLGKAAQTSAGDVSKASDSVKRSAKDSAESFDKAAESADKVDTRAMGFRDTLTGVQDTMSGTAMIAKGDLFQGFFTLGMGIGDLASGFANFLIPAMGTAGKLMVTETRATITSTAATIGHKVATIASATATKAMTAAQWLLNAAMSANPLGLVIKGVMLLVGAVVIAYQKSETFRNIVDNAFSVVKEGALTLALVAVKAFHFLLGVWLTVAGGIVNGAANAFGWVPGLGPKLQGAARGFNSFKDSVNASLDKVEKDLEVTIATEKAKRQADALVKYFKSRDWTVGIKGVFTAAGKAMGGGSGGGRGGSVRPVPGPIGTGWNGYPGHKGLDFPVRSGTPVRALMSGRVARDGWDSGGFGNHIRTFDRDGNMTIYGHLSRDFVKVGQTITAGQHIADSGYSGNVRPRGPRGAHLHLERRHFPYGPGSAYNFTPMLFDSGGILPTGISIVRNNTGKPEPLAPVDRMGPVIRIYLDGRELDRSRVRYERQTA